MYIEYHITKCFLTEDNLVIFFPTEILGSMNEVLEYSQNYFNNKKTYQTREEGSNESYIKCVSDEYRWIHLLEMMNIDGFIY